MKRETAPKSPEGTPVPTNAEEMLKNDEFLKFLTKYPDSAEVAKKNDEAKMQERFDIFNKKEAVARNLREFYRGDIKTDLGLELSDANLKVVDNHVEKIALTDEMLFRGLAKDLERLKENEAKVAAKKAKIDEYRNVDTTVEKRELNADIDKADLISQAQDSTRVWGESGRFERGLLKFFTVGFGKHPVDAARKIVSTDLGLQLDFELLDIELEKLAKQIEDKEQKILEREASIKKADDEQEYIDSLKREIFTANDLSEELAKVAKQVADEKFKSLLSDPDYPKAVENRKAEIAAKGGEVAKMNADLDAKKAELKQMETGRDALGRQMNQLTTTLKAEKDDAKKEAIEKSIASLSLDITKMSDRIKAKRDDLADLQLSVIQKEDEAKAFGEQEIQKKPASEKNLTEAQKIIDNLKSDYARESVYGEVIQLDDLDKMSADIQVAVQDTLKNVIEGTQVGKSGFDAMDKALGALLSKDVIGHMSGADVKTFLRGTLEWVMGELPKDKDGDVKRILLNHLMHKHGLSDAI